MKSPLKKDIHHILLENNFLNESQVESATNYSKKEGVRFLDACVKLKLLDERKMYEATALQSNIPFVTLKDEDIDTELMESLPFEMLHKGGIVLTRVMGDVKVVTSAPSEILLIDDVERMIEAKGERVCGVAVARDSEIRMVLEKGGAVKKIFDTVKEDKAEKKEDKTKILTLDEIAQDTSPAVKIVNTTIYDAMQKGASDIHFETSEHNMQIKYRLDGVLIKALDNVSKTLMSSVVSRIKVMSELDISETRIPQDGRFKVKLMGREVDFRVSIMPAMYGEDCVIRILDKEHIVKEFEGLTLDILGIEDELLLKLRKRIREPYGMFLVTGPTGSGKTTTLYGALSEVNDGVSKIITIEDPVEYGVKGVTQIPVNQKKGLTFAKGLRSILRHDPDKIMVGEIRDKETAEIAIQAALTGHLVFTTVHANNVFDVIGRFTHMGIDPFNFVSSLNCVMAQRLVRVLCENCKEEHILNEEELAELGLKKTNKKKVFKACGCEECNDTGYKGRRTIMEFLDLDDEVRDMIGTREKISSIKDYANKHGFTTLRENAVSLLLAGVTSLEEINRVTFVS